jgi:AraC-like DNA-binding protein
MRGNVARRWKVSDLASEVGMSRTSFAERFKILVGGYGAARLPDALAHDDCPRCAQREDANLATIAEAIGYESDTAFSLAFKSSASRPPPDPDAAPQHGRIKGKTARCLCEEKRRPST